MFRPWTAARGLLVPPKTVPQPPWSSSGRPSFWLRRPVPETVDSDRQLSLARPNPLNVVNQLLPRSKSRMPVRSI
ncbi:hypothetical protein V6N11_027337 [Hibiscus sabdariffa]|uniref:Uncharacterized protein n=1 Tax=Hibiscus sabdariffa TaxID=183260 RepID=A0ABR2PGM8_9ROSI